MNVSECTSERLEVELREKLQAHAMLCFPGSSAHADAVWMLGAVEELRLRRLARSAG